MFLLARATQAAAQDRGIRTYCNPLDIEYRYSLKQLDIISPSKPSARRVEPQ